MKGGGGGGRSAVIWRVVHRVSTAVPQLQDPIGVHQESYFILNLFPLFTPNYLFFSLYCDVTASILYFSVRADAPFVLGLKMHNVF